MPRCNEVVTVPHLIIKGAELNKSVAHHIGIRRESGANFIHSVTGYLAPILLMAVYDLQTAAVSCRYNGGHLKVFFRRTVPLFLFFGPYFDVKAIGKQP